MFQVVFKFDEFIAYHFYYSITTVSVSDKKKLLELTRGERTNTESYVTILVCTNIYLKVVSLKINFIY